MTKKLQVALAAALVVSVVVVLALNLNACQGAPEPAATATATATATTPPTQAQQAPTATAAPASPVPQPTPAPKEATPAPAPTPTPTPSPAAPPDAPTPSPPPDPTATPPAPTVTPTPTEVTTPTPTPTPAPPASAAIAMAMLVSDTGADAGDVRLISYEQVEWPSAALGCPEPGIFYAQVLTPGWKYLIGLGDEVYEFHASDSDDALVNCTAVENMQMQVDTVNVVTAAGLRDTVSVAVLRRNFTSGEYEENSVTEDPDIIKGIVDILDVEIKVSPAEDCTAVFRLRFDLPGGSETFDWICEGRNSLFAGGQPFWGGGQGEAPLPLGNMIGPLLTKTPPPPVPPS